MLEETSGPAYEHDFRAIPPRGGNIKPGHVKSLSEDAFRIYSAGKVKLINCTATNMRKGFAVSRGGPAYLKNCVSIGNGAILSPVNNKQNGGNYISPDMIVPDFDNAGTPLKRTTTSKLKEQ